MTLETCWRPLIDVDLYNLPSRKVCNNWRRMIPWLCPPNMIDNIDVIMNDDDYVMEDRVEVLEDNGVWMEASIYRRKDTGGVCLYFGGSDYEGLPGTYSYRSGVMRDSDGDVIQVRGVGEEKGRCEGEGGDENETNSTLVEEEIEEEIVVGGGEGGDDDELVGVMIEEEVVGGDDQELNSYYNDGVSPDFILEDEIV